MEHKRPFKRMSLLGAHSSPGTQKAFVRNTHLFGQNFFFAVNVQINRQKYGTLNNAVFVSALVSS